MKISKKAPTYAAKNELKRQSASFKSPQSYEFNNLLNLNFPLTKTLR